jgi:hypothetical protein
MGDPIGDLARLCDGAVVGGQEPGGVLGAVGVSQHRSSAEQDPQPVSIADSTQARAFTSDPPRSRRTHEEYVIRVEPVQRGSRCLVDDDDSALTRSSAAV